MQIPWHNFKVNRMIKIHYPALANNLQRKMDKMRSAIERYKITTCKCLLCEVELITKFIEVTNRQSSEWISQERMRWKMKAENN